MERRRSLVARGVETLSRIGWLSRCPEDFRAAVLRSAHWYQVAPDVEFIHAFDSNGGLFAVAEGTAEISFLHGHPDARFLHIARAGFWSGQRPLLGRTRTLSLRSRSGLVWALVPQAAMQALLSATPRWWEHVAQLGEDGCELLAWALSDLSLHDSQKRAAGVLLRLAGCRRAEDEGALPMEITLSQQEIADMAVMSRASFGRILSCFLEWGWIHVSYARISIRDSAAMRQFVDDLD